MSHYFNGHPPPRLRCSLYRGTSLYIPCWQMSLHCAISHSVKNHFHLTIIFKFLAVYKQLLLFFAAWTIHFQIMIKERPTKCIFNPLFTFGSLLTTHRRWSTPYLHFFGWRCLVFTFTTQYFDVQCCCHTPYVIALILLLLSSIF
jgi:hypothetical protein